MHSDQRGPNSQTTRPQQASRKDSTGEEHVPTETSPLLEPGADTRVDGKAETNFDGPVNWRREARIIANSAAPLVITYFLQYGVDVASVIAAGRLGSTEFAAVTLANMSAVITCFGPFQGFATALDTLCSQAYGSGEKHLVGIYCQRMVLLLLSLAVPVALLWFFSAPISLRIAPSVEVAALCTTYLRILIFAVPGFAIFEAGKRFLQSQGHFRPTTYLLLVAGPTNAFLLWLFVWRCGLGFVGLPIAVAVTRTLLPLLLILYVRFFAGLQCWGGLSTRALKNMWTMLKLAVPGMVIMWADEMVFEIMTVISGRFGVQELAAQSVLINLVALSYQVPFSVSVAASTRIAGVIGAGHVDTAKMAAKMSVIAYLLCGSTNAAIYLIFRKELPYVFTTDEAVASLATSLLPLLAVVTVFDGFAIMAHGVLRGIGRQAIGGPTNLISYYAIALPLSIGFAFGLHWELFGLWTGLIIGLILICLVEYPYAIFADWQETVLEAKKRKMRDNVEVSPASLQ